MLGSSSLKNSRTKWVRTKPVRTNDGFWNLYTPFGPELVLPTRFGSGFLSDSGFLQGFWVLPPPGSAEPRGSGGGEDGQNIRSEPDFYCGPEPGVQNSGPVSKTCFYESGKVLQGRQRQRTSGSGLGQTSPHRTGPGSPGAPPQRLP